MKEVVLSPRLKNGEIAITFMYKDILYGSVVSVDDKRYFDDLVYIVNLFWEDKDTFEKLIKQK